MPLSNKDAEPKNMLSLETALISAAAKEVASPASALLTKWGRNKFDEISAKFSSCFEGHVKSTQEKCSKIKNILYRDHSVEFDSQYVASNFAHGNKIYSDEELLTRALSQRKVLVSGTAGAGKTMFMRWCALRLTKGISAHGRIPLFLEMRYAEKDITNQPLENFIFDKTSSEKEAANFEQFKHGLKSGLFVIILDAIDEVPPSYRKGAIQRILDFIQKFPECSLLVSTRPEESFASVQEFSVYHTTPMSLEQISNVIGNLEYDEEVKSSLVAQLNAGLYKRLEEFLSNPLLATIMLLSFDYAGEVPSKLTGFYKQAFEALYQRHDAAKGAYKREHHAGLSLDEFQRVFAAFCFESYMSFKFEFSDAELLEAFTSAINYEGLEAKAELVGADARESVCLIVRDGWDNVFSHRSFQEYFCARFIASYREDDAGDLIAKLMGMEANSNVARMLYELSPELFEYEWVLPLLDEFIERFGRLRPDTKSGLAKCIDGISRSIYPNLDNGHIEYVTWGDVHREGHPIGYLISGTEFTMGRKNLGYSELYRLPIWEDFYDYVESLPEEIRPDNETLETRIERSPFGPRDDERDEAEYIGLYDKDAPWLIQSKLPEAYKNMISIAKEARSEILERRADRRSSVGDLLKKARRSSRLPR